MTGPQRMTTCPACYGSLNDDSHEVTRTLEMLQLDCANGFVLDDRTETTDG